MQFVNSFHSRFESKLSASISDEASTSLSTYHLEFKDKHFLFESFLVELIKHLDEGPILQTVQVSDRITFHHETILDDHKEAELLDQDSDVFMFCRAVPNGSTIKSEKSTCLLPSGLESDDGFLSGSVGDCCLEVDSDDNLDNQFWGLVVKSSLFPKMQGCFLLRTTRSSSSDHCSCQCTHYSLTRVSAGVPLVHQFDAAWLV